MDCHEQFRRAATESGVPEDESARFAGLIRFRIRHDDLAAARFDKALSFSEFTE